MYTDIAKETTLGTWVQVCKDAGAHSPLQNHTEVEIKELKNHVPCLMARIKSPKPLWDFCTLYTMDLSCEAFITITWKHFL